MIAIVFLALGVIAGLAARSIIRGTENAITELDRRDREDKAASRRAWMAMNHEDREWYNRYGNN